jgi:hypothetical protein
MIISAWIGKYSISKSKQQLKSDLWVSNPLDFNDAFMKAVRVASPKAFPYDVPGFSN